MLRFTASIALSLLVVPAFFGAEYFVDNRAGSGCANSSTIGTIDRPWCSINYGVGQIASGDTLVIRGGTYNETVTITGLHSSASTPTNIKAYPGETVTIVGPGISGGRVKINDCSYLVFEGIRITNFNQGLFIEAASHHITVRGCEIFDIGQEGLHVRQNCSYVEIDNCTIHDTRLGTANGEGIYIGTGSAGPLDNSHHITVRGCHIYNTIDEAIELKPGTHDCIIEDNTIHDSTTSPQVGAVEIGAHALGVQLWEGNPNHLVRNNTIHDCNTAIRLGTGSIAYNNVIYDIAADSYGVYVANPASDGYQRRIFHNTIDLPGSRAVRVAAGQTSVLNNIGPDTTGNVAANAGFFANTSEGAEDYRLVTGAAAINAGGSLSVEITTDRDGNARTIGAAPDLGAYEFGTDSAPIAPSDLRATP